jgi:hypothetical protein
VAASDAVGLVVAGNDNIELDNYIDDGGESKRIKRWWGRAVRCPSWRLDTTGLLLLLPPSMLAVGFFALVAWIVALAVALWAVVIGYPSAIATHNFCCFQEMKIFLPLLGLLSWFRPSPLCVEIRVIYQQWGSICQGLASGVA